MAEPGSIVKQELNSVILNAQGEATRVGLYNEDGSISTFLDVERIPGANAGDPARIMLVAPNGTRHQPNKFEETHGLTEQTILNAENRSRSRTDNSTATSEEKLLESYIKAGMSPSVACRRARAKSAGITEAAAKAQVEKEGDCLQKYQAITQRINTVTQAARTNDLNTSEQYKEKAPYTTDEFRVKLTSNVTKERVVFHVSPNIDESRSASYDQIAPAHHPGPIHVYKTTNARNFNINGKLVARTRQEATRNLMYVNLIRSWVMPYYGEGTANNPFTAKNMGAPPDILTLTGYGEFNLKDIPVILTSYSWTYPDNVDYIPTLAGVPFPAIIDLSLMLMESNSPEEFSNFDLVSYKLGLFNRAFRTGGPTSKNLNTTAKQYILDSNKFARKSSVKE